MSQMMVVTTSNDLTAPRVIKRLRQEGRHILNFTVDTMADGRDAFSLSIKNGNAILECRKSVIPMGDVQAAWFWHPKIHYDHIDSERSTAILREMHQTLSGVWSSIDNERWINPPRRVLETQNKIPQQLLAGQVGFSTGCTILTNRWENIADLGEKTIIKMPGTGVLNGSEPKVMYTTILDSDKRKALTDSSPFPGMHQPYIPKKREWRVTVVGEKVFPVAIYTDKTAKDDWRKHQHTDGKVTFKSEPLPDATIEVKCKVMLRKLGLRYGAFDFIETPDGEMVFLEVNSAGQYGWLEDQLGLPISEAIADLLIEIADR